MTRRLSLLGFLTLINFGAIGMAAQSPKLNEITWAAPPGQMNPDPPSRLVYNDKTVTAYSWGRRIAKLRADGVTVPIGKFEVNLTADMRHSIDEMEGAITENIKKIRGDKLDGLVARFNFTRDGKDYHGHYSGGLGVPFAKKLWPISSLYSEVVLHGSPIVSFSPSIHVKEEGSRFAVTLAFNNTGREPVTLAGPATWTNNPDMLPLPHVRVFGHKENSRAFVFVLSKENFYGTEADAEKFTIQPGKTTQLTFMVPLTSAQSLGVFKGISIAGQTFEYSSDIKINILDPEDMRGIAVTYAQ